MFLTLEVLKWLKSRLVSLVQFLNMEPMFVTFDVFRQSQLSISVSPDRPQNQNAVDVGNVPFSPERSALVILFLSHQRR